MKTKELVRLLQKADPTGEVDCCVDGIDIFSVQRLPAFQDGPKEVLHREADRKPNFDVVRGTISRRGEKVLIKTLSLRSALVKDPDLHIEVLDCDERTEHQIQKWRDEARRL
jgi:hypothetical protein